MLAWVDAWRVGEELLSSDHNGMVFDIHLNRSKDFKVERTTRQFNTKKAKWNDFRSRMSRLISDNSIKINNQSTKTKHDYKIQRDRWSGSVRGVSQKSKTQLLTMPWWSAPVRREWVVSQYLEQKERNESEVRMGQDEGWKSFCRRQGRKGDGRRSHKPFRPAPHNFRAA